MIAAVEGGVVLDVRVQPSAGRTGVAGRHGDALKLRVGAPPVEGRANAAVVAFLAEQFGVKAAAVSIVSGETSRQKRVKLEGVDEAAARAVVDRLLLDVRSKH